MYRLNLLNADIQLIVDGAWGNNNYATNHDDEYITESFERGTD